MADGSGGAASTDQTPFRIGLGYDSHRLAAAGSDPGIRPLVIGGVRFPASFGAIAHSDGDALMHAITDAILGALGLPDIGQQFPDRDPKWRGAASETFLGEAVRQAASAGWGIGNVDATVIVQAPKIGPRKDEIRHTLARMLAVAPDRVNVKGKTHELADPERLDERLEAMAVVLLVRK